MFRSLTVGKYYSPGVESVLTGEMQARYIFSKRNPEQPHYHPNYFIENMYSRPSFEDPHQTRRMIRGAYVLRAVGIHGQRLDELRDLANSDELVPNLIDLNERHPSYSSLGIEAALKDLKHSKMVSEVNDLVLPELKIQGVLRDVPEQPTTVIMFDKLPTMAKAVAAHEIYDRLAGL